MAILHSHQYRIVLQTSLNSTSGGCGHIWHFSALVKISHIIIFHSGQHNYSFLKTLNDPPLLVVAVFSFTMKFAVLFIIFRKKSQEIQEFKQVNNGLFLTREQIVFCFLLLSFYMYVGYVFNPSFLPKKIKSSMQDVFWRIS